MRKEVTFEDSESETEYDSEDEFYDDEESDEGGAYQLASDYDIEYDDDYDDEDDEGGVLYGGVRRRKRSVKRRKRSAYNRFVAKWAKKKKPGTKRYYNMKEIAAKWRKMHGLTRKKRSVSGSKKSMRRRTKRGGILMGGVKKKTTKRRVSRKAPRRSAINSLILQPDIQRYEGAENLCQQLGMMYCPLSQNCQEIDTGLKCLSRAGISYIRLKDGRWMTIGNDKRGYLSPLEALEWYKDEDPGKYDGGPILPTANISSTKFKSSLGNVQLGPIKKSGTTADQVVAKALGIDPANAKIFSDYLLKKNNLISN